MSNEKCVKGRNKPFLISPEGNKLSYDSEGVKRKLRVFALAKRTFKEFHLKKVQYCSSPASD